LLTENSKRTNILDIKESDEECLHFLFQYVKFLGSYMTLKKYLTFS